MAEAEQPHTSHVEHTIAVIKAPDNFIDVVTERIISSGFEIPTKCIRQLTKFEAVQFFRDEREKDSFDIFTDLMSSGPITVLLLQRNDAIEQWKALAPSLCVELTTGSAQSYIHCSANSFSAHREIQFFFPHYRISSQGAFIMGQTPSHRIVERTTVTIGPPELFPKHWDMLRAFLEKQGLLILAQAKCNGHGQEAVRDFLLLVLEGEDAVLKCKYLFKQFETSTVGNTQSIIDIEGTRFLATASKTAEEIEGQIREYFPFGITPEESMLVVESHQTELLSSAQRGLEMWNFDVLHERELRLSDPALMALVQSIWKGNGKSTFTNEEGDNSSAIELKVTVWVVSRPNAIQTLQYIAKSIVKEDTVAAQPSCLLGCPNSCESYGHLVTSFFPGMKTPKSLIRDISVTSFVGTKPLLLQPEGASLHQLLVLGMRELTKQRLEGLEAVRFLGEWLLQNNPYRPRDDGTDTSRGPRAQLPAPPSSTNVSVKASEVQNPEKAFQADPKALSAPTLPSSLPSNATGRGRQRRYIILLETTSAEATIKQNCLSTAKEYGYRQFDFQTILRQEINNEDSPFQDILASSVAQGQLGHPDLNSLSSQQCVEILSYALSKTTAHRVLLTGFPRSRQDTVTLEKVLGRCEKCILAAAENDITSMQRMRKQSLSLVLAKGEDLARVKEVFEFYDKIGRAVEFCSAEHIANAPENLLRVFRPSLICAVGVSTTDDKKTEKTDDLKVCAAEKECKALALASNYTYLSLESLLAIELEAAERSKDFKKSGELSQTDLELLRQKVISGEPLPSSIVSSLVSSALKKITSNGLLLEGYPFTVHQATALFSQLQMHPVHFLQISVAPSNTTDKSKTETTGTESKQELSGDISTRVFKLRKLAWQKDTAAVIHFYKQLGVFYELSERRESAPDGLKNQFLALSKQLIFIASNSNLESTFTHTSKHFRALGYTSVLPSEVLRHEMLLQSPLGVRIEKFVRSGQRVPSALTVETLAASLLASEPSKICVWGFPTVPEQLELLQDAGIMSTLLIRENKDSEKLPSKGIALSVHPPTLLVSPADLGKPQQLTELVSASLRHQIIFIPGDLEEKESKGGARKALGTTEICKEIARRQGYTVYTYKDLLEVAEGFSSSPSSSFEGSQSSNASAIGRGGKRPSKSSFPEMSAFARLWETFRERGRLMFINFPRSASQAKLLSVKYGFTPKIISFPEAHIPDDLISCYKEAVPPSLVTSLPYAPRSLSPLELAPLASLLSQRFYVLLTVYKSDWSALTHSLGPSAVCLDISAHFRRKFERKNRRQRESWNESNEREISLSCQEIVKEITKLVRRLGGIQDVFLRGFPLCSSAVSSPSAGLIIRVPPKIEQILTFDGDVGAIQKAILLPRAGGLSHLPHEDTAKNSPHLHTVRKAEESTGSSSTNLALLEREFSSVTTSDVVNLYDKLGRLVRIEVDVQVGQQESKDAKLSLASALNSIMQRETVRNM